MQFWRLRCSSLEQARFTSKCWTTTNGRLPTKSSRFHFLHQQLDRKTDSGNPATSSKAGAVHTWPKIICNVEFEWEQYLLHYRTPFDLVSLPEESCSLSALEALAQVGVCFHPSKRRLTPLLILRREENENFSVPLKAHILPSGKEPSSGVSNQTYQSRVGRCT